MKIGNAIAQILTRSPHLDERQISWEEITDEDNSVSLTSLEQLDWSDDVVSTPDANAWLAVGWRFVSISKNREVVHFRRDTGAAGFLGDGGLFPTSRKP